MMKAIYKRFSLLYTLVLPIKVLCMGICMCNLFGCTKADIHYPENKSTEGYVIIQPDQSTLTIPAQTYHFYNMDGITACKVLECDGQGNFYGQLPVGSYLVIASNTRAGYTDFRGMDSYETAVVYDTSLDGYLLPSRSTNEIVLGSDSVYSIKVEALNVTSGDTIKHTPVPECLTKSVTLTFTITGNISDRISALTGSLYGIYPSAHLYHCSTPDEDVAKSPEVYVNFTTTAPDESKPNIRTSTQINLFGLCNPEYGRTYRNVMPLAVTVNNTVYEVEADLTDYLSDLLDNYKGVIPLEIPLEIELDLLQMKAMVKPWTSGGGGTYPIPY